MKRIVKVLAIILLAMKGYAQTDSTTIIVDTIKMKSSDTLRVGNFVIVKKNKNTGYSGNEDNGHSFNIRIGTGSSSASTRKYHNQSNFNTNWMIFDLGFANYRDNTDYGSSEANNVLKKNIVGEADFSKNDLKLRINKSSNVNIWFFMQKMNVINHVVNLKYGLGLEMFNLRYEKNISYHQDPFYIYRDSVSFSKNKLYAGYLTVPFMINFNTSPYRNKGLSISAGISAGYLVGSHTKQISGNRGQEKLHGDLNLQPWHVAWVAELGLGPIRLYGSYSLNALHQNGLKQYPYAVGIRFSNW